MKEKIKNQKGFIQIPLLLIIIVLAVATSAGTGYVLHKTGKLAPLEKGISNLFKNNKSENQNKGEQKLETIQQPKTVLQLSTEKVSTNNSRQQEQTLKTTPPSIETAPSSPVDNQSTNSQSQQIQNIICINNAILCNNHCWSQCSSSEVFYCPLDGSNAICLSKNPKSNMPSPENQKTDEQQRVDEMLEVFNAQLAEKQRQSEIALQQMHALQEEMKQLKAPIQSELDALNTKIEQECPVTVYIGSQAQQCNIWRADGMVLLAKLDAITNDYRLKMGLEPTLNFTTQQSVLGQHYKFYYDGYGSGSIYNTSNPTESYKIYCSYGKCDIYGN